MALTEDDVKALRSIIKEELAAELQPFRDEVNGRFDDVNRRFEEVNGRFEHVNRRFDVVANQIAGLLRRRELFRDEVNRRFDEVATQIDGLYQHDEKREQEYFIYPRTNPSP